MLMVGQSENGFVKGTVLSELTIVYCGFDQAVCSMMLETSSRI